MHALIALDSCVQMESCTSDAEALVGQAKRKPEDLSVRLRVKQG
jgi:hypothetical protein